MWYDVEEAAVALHLAPDLICIGAMSSQIAHGAAHGWSKEILLCSPKLALFRPPWKLPTYPQLGSRSSAPNTKRSMSSTPPCNRLEADSTLVAGSPLSRQGGGFALLLPWTAERSMTIK
jgi:hypothetical protein